MQNVTTFVPFDGQTHNAVTTISLKAARISIVAIITYQVMLAALIFVRPDLDPYWHTISEYAIGSYGWIMSLAFLVAALSYGSLCMAIRGQTGGVFGKIGLGILVICTVGLIGVGLCTTDPLDTPPDAMTTRGIIHLICGATQLMLLPFAAVCLNLSLAFKNHSWATARRVLLLTAGLPLLGLIGFIAHLVIYIIPLGAHAYGPGVPLGWPSRFLFSTYMVWLITLALQAMKVRNGKEV